MGSLENKKKVVKILNDKEKKLSIQQFKKINQLYID